MTAPPNDYFAELLVVVTAAILIHYIGIL